MSGAASTIPTPATPDVCTAKVLIDGQEIPGTIHVLAIAVTREVNRIPTATLHIADGDAAAGTFAVADGNLFVPGKSIEVKLGYHGQDDTVFRGLVIRFSVRIRRDRTMLVVECRDEAVKMTAGRRSFYYENKKDHEIIEAAIGRAGLKKSIEPTTPALKEVVQYDATDWDFILCRAEANGLFVVPDDGTVRVVKCDAGRTPVVATAFGATVLELDADVDARLQPPGRKALSWSAADQAVVDATAAEPTTTNQGNLQPSTLAGVLGGGDRTLRHGGPLAAPELQAWADGQLLRDRLAKVRGRVRFQGFAGVRPADIVELQQLGNRLQGKVWATAVRHQFAGGNWETDVQFGLDPTPVAERYDLRPLPAAGLLPAVAGLQIGVVTALGGDPDGEDRIRVRLPLVDPAADGVWARIATLDAGKDRGTYFRPEIGDEVVTGFLHDDPRYPVVLGMCHSSAKPAPEPPDDKNHHKGYVSREKMKFTFDDDKKRIVLETPGGNKMTIADDDKGLKFEDQNGNKITLDNQGITIESFKDLTIKAKQDVRIEGMNVGAKAQTAFKAEGSATAEVTAANTKVKGSATTTIQGGLVQIN